jgi:hypothetical protein
MASIVYIEVKESLVQIAKFVSVKLFGLAISMIMIMIWNLIKTHQNLEKKMSLPLFIK